MTQRSIVTVEYAGKKIARLFPEYVISAALPCQGTEVKERSGWLLGEECGGETKEAVKDRLIHAHTNTYRDIGIHILIHL